MPLMSLKKEKEKRQALLSDGSFSRAALHDLQFKMILILVHAINLKQAVYTSFCLSSFGCSIWEERLC